jgi:hypothetical protein
MYLIQNLKPSLAVNDDTVSCPVKDCSRTVKKQTVSFKTEPDFLCETHGIYISPSTFEYANYLDNLLWRSPDDISLLERIFTVKRESRMARDNSEDSLTWNVVRYLEQSQTLGPWLESVAGAPVRNPQVIYWSYCQRAGTTWPLLGEARKEFGETPQRGSEPDIIVESDDALYFIEAKFISGNETKPSHPNDSKQYLSGGDKWYERVFASPYGTVAVEQKFYELMRFWLLGTWAAKQQGKRFVLVNLVRESEQRQVVANFSRHIKTNGHQFLRTTWEDAYRFVKSSARAGEDREVFLKYIEGKSVGYNGMRKLVPAFSVRS